MQSNKTLQDVIRSLCATRKEHIHINCCENALLQATCSRVPPKAMRYSIVLLTGQHQFKYNIANN